MNKNDRSQIEIFLENPLVTSALFLVYVVIIRFYIYPKYLFFLKDDFTLIQSFIEWFGVAYGLFIALVLVNVWSQFDSTAREFDREADAILMLFQSVKQIDESEKDIKIIKEEIINLIKAYVFHVKNNYIAEQQKLDRRDEGDSILEKIRDEIGKVIHSNEKFAVTTELIKELNDAIDLRGDRISHSKQRIPQPVLTISYVSSILWLIPFLGLNFENDWIAIVLVGGVTVIVIAILAIIKDLDNPFAGTWKIDSQEWELLGEKIGLSETLIFVFEINNRRIYRLWSKINEFLSKKICSLYSLLGDTEQQEILDSEFRDIIQLRVLYKDEFSYFYDKEYELPIILRKSGNLTKQFLNKNELNNIRDLGDLIQVIHQKL